MLVLKFKAFIYLGLLLLFLSSFLLIQTNKIHGVNNIKAVNSSEINLTNNKTTQVSGSSGKISGNRYLEKK